VGVHRRSRHDAPEEKVIREASSRSPGNARSGFLAGDRPSPSFGMASTPAATEVNQVEARSALPATMLQLSAGSVSREARDTAGEAPALPTFVAKARYADECWGVWGTIMGEITLRGARFVEKRRNASPARRKTNVRARLTNSSQGGTERSDARGRKDRPIVFWR
jgi:hypothetical protein